MILVIRSANTLVCKFSMNSGCINKIPLNPPLQKGEAIGMSALIEILRLIEVYHTLCDSVRSVRDNNNQKSSSEEDLSPNLSNRYLRDLMVIPKSLAALCFDPWAVSIAFRI